MYTYRITVESLGNPAQPNALAVGSKTFQVKNHDDLLKIVDSVQAKDLLDSEKSAALAIGLKLFSEVVFEKRLDPLFAPLLDPLHAFIKRLKAVGNPVAAGPGGDSPAA